MNESRTSVCQSCSMSMQAPEQFGTETDGSRNQTYCIHCYKDGQFTRPDATLDDMVKLYTPNWGKWVGKADMPLAEASREVRAVLSSLDRWKNQV